jgi:hypothetical protein
LQPYIGRWLRNIIALPVWAGHPNPANSTRAWKQNFRAKLIGALGAFYYSGPRCRCGHGVGRIHPHRDIEPPRLRRDFKRLAVTEMKDRLNPNMRPISAKRIPFPTR